MPASIHSFVGGWGSHHVTTDIRLGLITRQEPSPFLDRLQPGCCDHLDAHQRHSISRPGLVRRCGFQADDRSHPQGGPSAARACIRSEAGRPIHRGSTLRAEWFSTICPRVARRWPAISLALGQRTSPAVACLRCRASRVCAATRCTRRLAHESPSRHFCKFEAYQNGAVHLVLFPRPTRPIRCHERKHTNGPSERIVEQRADRHRHRR